MSATDPWADEWEAMSYAARLIWWWSARGAHQSQEDWVAGKEAPAGVSCKYGIPGTWPGSRIPYSKTPGEEPQAEGPKVEETKAEETTKQEETTKAEEPKQEETTKEEESKAEEPSMKKEETRPIIKLTIPPSTNAIHVSKNKKKQKNKH